MSATRGTALALIIAMVTSGCAVFEAPPTQPVYGVWPGEAALLGAAVGVSMGVLVATATADHHSHRSAARPVVVVSNPAPINVRVRSSPGERHHAEAHKPVQHAHYKPVQHAQHKPSGSGQQKSGGK